MQHCCMCAKLFLLCRRIMHVPALKTIGKSLGILAGTCGLTFLVALYLLGSANVESFHSLFHADDAAEIHNSESETDPCHIRIYHEGAAAACDHEAHVIEDSKCSLSTVHLLSSHLIIDVTVFSTQAALSISLVSVDSGSPFQPVSDSHGRAPPVS
jgi:hypothetical protein